MIAESLAFQSKHCLHLIKGVSGLLRARLRNLHIFGVMQLVGHPLADDRLAESLVDSLSVAAC